MSLCEEARRNREFRDRQSDDYEARHGEVIGRGEPRWGGWQIPESELHVIGDVAGRDATYWEPAEPEWAGCRLSETIWKARNRTQQ
jgi:hypothetical protein